MLKAIEIKPDVFWVGGIDWNERNFHGYTTERGSTYNAYLILDEKITLIDTCKKPFTGELIDRIADIVDPASIDYIVSNHVEMDHSGGLPALAEIAPKATIVTGAPKGVQGLRAHYGDGLNLVGLKTGDTLNIGKRTLASCRRPWCTGPIPWLPMTSSTASCSPTMPSASTTPPRNASMTRWGCRRCSFRRRSTTPTSSCPTARMWKRP